MSVTDINEQDRYIHERHNSFNLREFLSLTMHRRIGAVRRGYATTIDPIPFPAPVRDYIRLSIEFSSRNGTIRQWIFIYTGQSEWKKAVKIDRTASDGTTTLLHEDADPGFPLGADGKVNWAKRGYSSSD